MKRPRETAVFYSLHAVKRLGIIKSSKGNTAMFKNQSKYEPVVETDEFCVVDDGLHGRCVNECGPIGFYRGVA